MDETIKNEELKEVATEEEINLEESTDEQLKQAIEGQLTKIRRQSMLIGAQTACTVILEKIVSAAGKPGKRTMNDYRRLIKDIENFCRVGVSRKVNADGETEPIDNGSVNENNTKLMEEVNESNTNESN